jgi:hypothetical protein
VINSYQHGNRPIPQPDDVLHPTLAGRLPVETRLEQIVGAMITAHSGGVGMLIRSVLAEASSTRTTGQSSEAQYRPRERPSTEMDRASHRVGGYAARWFVRARCSECHEQWLLTFSFKTRELCPWCAAERLAWTAVLVAEKGLEEVSGRPRDLEALPFLVEARNNAWNRD